MLFKNIRSTTSGLPVLKRGPRTRAQPEGAGPDAARPEPSPCRPTAAADIAAKQHTEGCTRSADGGKPRRGEDDRSPPFCLAGGPRSAGPAGRAAEAGATHVVHHHVEGRGVPQYHAHVGQLPLRLLCQAGARGTRRLGVLIHAACSGARGERMA